MDYPEQIKRRFLMLGNGVFISAGFLGGGTTKSNDITSFNIHMCMYIHVWIHNLSHTIIYCI